MSIFLRKKRWTESQRVVLSAFLFSGLLVVLIAGIVLSARHPSYYSYQPTNEDVITQEMAMRVLNG